MAVVLGAGQPGVRSGSIGGPNERFGVCSVECDLGMNCYLKYWPISLTLSGPSLCTRFPPCSAN